MLKNHTKYLTIFLCLIAAAMTRLHAQDGSTAYNFLDIPMSSRIYGLGGVNISLVDDDVTVIDQNPALLGQEMSGQLALGYMRYVGESNFAAVRYAHSAGKHGAWSASLQYFDYGKIIETDEMGSQLGTFSPKDALLSLAYSYDITDCLRGGINLKTAYSAYSDYTAWAIAADLGINYFDADRDLSLSFVAANLGGQVKRFAEKYDRLPIDLRLGMSKVLGNLPLRLSVTAWNLTKWHLPYYDYGSGADSGVVEKKDKFFSNLMRHLVLSLDLVSSPTWYAGIGYNYKNRTDMLTYHRSLLSGFSLAAGLQVKSFGVGVALAQPATGATTFMLNLRLDINSIIK